MVGARPEGVKRIRGAVDGQIGLRLDEQDEGRAAEPGQQRELGAGVARAGRRGRA